MKISEKKKKTTPVSLHGVSKWIKEYRDRFCMDPEQLEQSSRTFLTVNKVKSSEQSQIQSNEDADDDGGWTVVSHSLKKTRQRMVPSTDKTLNRLRAKHKRSSERKELVNFYKFQMTDKKVDQLEQLKEKFELDKQRITQMRQQHSSKEYFSLETRQMAARMRQYLSQLTSFSCTLPDVVESKYFTLFMLAVVLCNTIVMIFETYDFYYHKYHSFFLLSEKIFLCIYMMEFCLKIWVYLWRYFKNLWNCFDLFIIIVSIVDLITQQVTHENTHSPLQIDHNQQIPSQFERFNHFLKILRVLRVLRSFRALRVLRTIRFIQSIHTIVKTCSKALPPMASITFIMIILTCISAILARSLFGEVCPEKFDNLVKTIFSLFTLLTLDDWYSIYLVCEQHEYSSFQLAFCLIYIFIINFILLNLLMAVLVDNFQHTLNYDTKKNEQSAKEHNAEERIMNNFNKLNAEYGVRRNDLTWGPEMKEIQKRAKEYYTLMESLEIRMERHEQLTKLAQKAIQLTLLDQDNRKMNMKK